MVYNIDTIFNPYVVEDSVIDYTSSEYLINSIIHYIDTYIVKSSVIISVPNILFV